MIVIDDVAEMTKEMWVYLDTVVKGKVMGIVERLRTKKEKYIATVDYGIGVYEELADSDTPDADCIEAADEIVRLRKILSTVLEACEDVNSPDRKVRKEITRTVGKALKEKE